MAATARSSQPRAAAQANCSSSGEHGVQLADKLNIFKTNGFDPDAYVQSKCHTMNEKEIRHLCSYLQDLKKASAEEMRKSVYANYASFIRTSKEISDLEGELLSIRNLLSSQAALIHGLAEGVRVESVSSGCPEDLTVDDILNVDDRKPSDLEKWVVEFPDMLDVLLAERRVDESLVALDEAECVAVEAKEKNTLSEADLLSFKKAITDHRQRLADQLAEVACQSSTRGTELRASASALKRLGDGSRAHSLLLNAHYERLQYNMQTIHPTNSSYAGGAYTAALSQQVFSAIAQAVNDSSDVFGDESSYASEMVIWSTKQAEAFANLVKRHALASSTAAGGLTAAAECVQIAIGHCSLLEAHGLSLSSVLMKLFRPSVEQALDAHLKRIEESTAALAAADDWVLIYPPPTTRAASRISNTTYGIQKLSISAHRFNSMVQDFFEDVVPLLSMQLGGSTLDGVLRVFNSYISLLVNALPGSMEDETNLEGLGTRVVKLAETESQQLSLLANASSLAEELLPRAAMKLSPMYQSGGKDGSRKRASDRHSRTPEQREWKRKLQRSVDGLRDNFCRQHALDLIFTEDGDTNLNAEMYLCMDDTVEEPDWCPSPIFQELYAKLNRMAIIAADMFIGRERFATLLLMRLTETVILWLSEDQTFWEDIEEGSRPLGPLGLQQFYLDMQFVIHSGQGCFLSRHVHQVIIKIIERGMAAFSVTGIDPDSVLPSDDWFADIAQETVSKISGRAKIPSADRELSSPTASVSALSISSFRSHGSS